MIIVAGKNAREKLDAMWAKLPEGGKEMTPLGNYGFSKKFCWLVDKYSIKQELS